MKTITIREACIEDAPLILQFIIDLATYEKAQHEVKTSLAELKESLFSKHSTAHALICLADDKPVGFAVYFYSFSTWLGKKWPLFRGFICLTGSSQLGSWEGNFKTFGKFGFRKRL